MRVVVTADAAWLTECECASVRLLHGAINASAVPKLQAAHTATATRNNLVLLLICKQIVMPQEVHSVSYIFIAASNRVQQFGMDGRDQSWDSLNSRSFVAAAPVQIG
jgi:hypothetical protein